MWRPDAKFEVLGAPYSLLSASLSASQPFYTRRGTLVGLNGKPENVRTRARAREGKAQADLGAGRLPSLRTGPRSASAPRHPILLPEGTCAADSGPVPAETAQITSASPVTALIASKSALTSFVVVHMDGTVDWMVAQRRALLAWTGQTLSIAPTINTKFVRLRGSGSSGRH